MADKKQTPDVKKSRAPKNSKDSNITDKSTPKNTSKSNKPPKTFQLIKQIRGVDQGGIDGEKDLYKSNVQRRDRIVREELGSLDVMNNSTAVPGQMILFNYFEPKTKEELKYYDAMPCTIFFGVFNTEQGRRVLGFNLHYYPPKIRFALMDRIFDIYKPIYLKSWDKPLNSEMSYFNYKQLIEQLQDAGLEFGVRMYIPNLMKKITPIPPSMYAKAVFTEGHFKKETRQQILKYWRDKLEGKKEPDKKPDNKKKVKK
jgi:hypothetical protein